MIPLYLVFLGRIKESKGIFDLPEIVSLVKSKIFDSYQKAVVFTNEQPKINEVLELKYYDDDIILMKINKNFYRPAEVDLLLGDSNEARTELNWTPEVSFQNLVEKILLSNNKIWLRFIDIFMNLGGWRYFNYKMKKLISQSS